MGVCAGAFFGCLALRILCVLVVPEVYLDAGLLERITFLRADSLLLGGYVALALRGPAPQWVHSAARRVFSTLVVGFVLLEALHWVAKRSLIRAGTNDPWMGTIGFSLIDLFSASVVVLALDRSSWAGRLGTWEPLRQLGVISYGFYVFHDLPHEIYGALATAITHRSAFTPWLAALMAFFGTLMLASLSYVVLETPFLKLKRYFVAESDESETVEAADYAVVPSAAI
jgi:peptidoglycan/LPS O-acetylase OafA/YrhL